MRAALENHRPSFFHRLDGSPSTACASSESHSKTISARRRAKLCEHPVATRHRGHCTSTPVQLPATKARIRPFRKIQLGKQTEIFLKPQVSRLSKRKSGNKSGLKKMPPNQSKARNQHRNKLRHVAIVHVYISTEPVPTP